MSERVVPGRQLMIGFALRAMTSASGTAETAPIFEVLLLPNFCLSRSPKRMKAYSQRPILACAEGSRHSDHDPIIQRGNFTFLSTPIAANGSQKHGSWCFR